MKRIIVLVFVGVFFCAGMAQAVSFTDFGFGSGTPFGGVTTLDGIDIVLTSTGTGPHDTIGFRAPHNTEHATVDISFDKYISEFYIDLIYVRSDEFTHSFNIGSPTGISGTLYDLGGGMISTWDYMGDLGAGRLSWTGLNTDNVSFLVDASLGSALAFVQFGITASPVPEPTTLFLLGTGLTGLAAARRRKKQA